MVILFQLMNNLITIIVDFFSENLYGKLILIIFSLPIGAFLNWIRVIYNKWKLSIPIKDMLEENVEYLNNLNKKTSFKDSGFVNPDLFVKTIDYINPEYEVTKSIISSIRGYNIISEDQLLNSLRNSNRDLMKGLFRKNDEQMGIYKCRNFSKAFKKSGYRTILLGEPGSGKSVTVRNYAIKISQKTLSGHGKDIPIYLPLSSWVKSNSGKKLAFSEFLEEIFSNTVYSLFMNGEWFKYKKNIVLILDGVDELPRSAQENSFYLNELNTWFEKNNVKVIFTCRINDYNNNLVINKTLIRPFNEEKISKIIKKRLPYVYKEFEFFLLKNRYMYELCRNPFNLSLICQYQDIKSNQMKKKSDVFFPDKMVEFYHTVVKALLAKDKEIARSNAKQRACFNALEKLSFFLTVKVRQNSITLENIKKDEIGKYKPVYEMCIKVGILHIINNNLLAFTHHRYQEYFCACYLSKNEADYPAELRNNIWWREIVLLISQMLEEPTPFIKSLVENPTVLEYSGAKDVIEEKDKTIIRQQKIYQLLLAYECSLINKNCDSDFLNEMRKVLFKEYKEDFEIAAIINIAKKDLSNKTTKEYLLSIIKIKTGFLASEAFSTLTENTSQDYSLRDNVYLLWEFWCAGKFFYNHKRMSKAVSILRLKDRCKSTLLGIWLSFLWLLQILVLAVFLNQIYMALFILDIFAKGRYGVLGLLIILLFYFFQVSNNGTGSGLKYINAILPISLGMFISTYLLKISPSQGIFIFLLGIAIALILSKFKVYLKYDIFYSAILAIITFSIYLFINITVDIGYFIGILSEYQYLINFSMLIILIIIFLIFPVLSIFQLLYALKKSNIFKIESTLNELVENVYKLVMKYANKELIITYILTRYIIRNLKMYTLNEQIIILKQLNVRIEDSPFKDNITKIIIEKEREMLREC